MTNRFIPSILRRWSVTANLALVAVLFLAACGGSGHKQGAQIQWIDGTPPNQVAQQEAPVPTNQPEQQPTQQTAPTETSGDTSAAQPTAADGDANAAQPTATVKPETAAVTGRKLSAEELTQYQPDELGIIPILEYHNLVKNPKDAAQFARPVDGFRDDLQWLYDHNFYVVPLKDIITDNISAPAGKHPVALTFDDSYASQFRYLIAADGSTTIDPDSAVGIMEAMYAAHLDFGRGGFFATLPGNFCFNWNPDPEPDQDAFCGQKIKWLLDNGYEIGNHTLDHKDLLDVDDDYFKTQVGGAVEALQQYDPRVEANILAVPFGNYPDSDKYPEQRDWMKNGFEYDGKQIKLIGCLMVGAEPAKSPVSVDWDSMWIPRIQAADMGKDEYGYTSYWFPIFADNEGWLYTSDGDPNTITVPRELPPSLKNSFDETKADGKELVRY